MHLDYMIVVVSQDVNYLFKLKNDGGNFLPNETKVMIGNTCIDKYSGTEGADEMQPTIPEDLCSVVLDQDPYNNYTRNPAISDLSAIGNEIYTSIYPDTSILLIG